MQYQPLHDLNWKVGHEIILPPSRIALCSSPRSSSLSRIENRLQEALDQQPRAPDLVDFVDEMDELTPLHPLKYTPARSVAYLQASTVERTLTESTLCEPGKVRPERSPSPSDSSFSEFDAAKSVTANPYHKLGHWPTGSQPAERTNGNLGVGIAESKTLLEAVADARRQLVSVRQREHSSRPLKLVSQDPERTPDPALCAIFQKSADDELQIRRLNARDWLRVATWWLLKVHLHISYRKS